MAGNYGEKIKEARIRRGMTQRGLAEAVGNYPGDISKWEQDKNIPGADKLFKIAVATETPIDFFYPDIKSKDRPKKTYPGIESYDYLQEHSAAMLNGVIKDVLTHGTEGERRKLIYAHLKFIGEATGLWEGMMNAKKRKQIA